MIIVTGAAGFIGSNLVARLNAEGYRDVVAVDDFSREDKNRNLAGKELTGKDHRDEFFTWLSENHRFVQFIFHLGARTDTAEFDRNVFRVLNIDYSRRVWEDCIRYGLPLIYASSAATYGRGEKGYDDDHRLIPELKPLNPYGESKQVFDMWALEQEKKPYFWAGLKFFNVYGPNEYHKGRMASVVLHAWHQISKTGEMKLFRSHRPDVKDGEQKRDFIYVKDVTDAMVWMMQQRKHSGIYNLGTGRARTFLDLARSVFAAAGKPERIRFIDTPEDIRDKYQYFTEARVEKLQREGYKKPFTSLEEGIRQYVKEFLIEGRYE